MPVHDVVSRNQSARVWLRETNTVMQTLNTNLVTKTYYVHDCLCDRMNCREKATHYSQRLCQNVINAINIYNPVQWIASSYVCQVITGSK